MQVLQECLQENNYFLVLIAKGLPVTVAFFRSNVTHRAGSAGQVPCFMSWN
jgi:hypothetical protein